MRSFVTRRATALTAALILGSALTVAGCGDDDADGPDTTQIENQVDDAVDEGTDNLDEGAEKVQDEADDAADEAEEKAEDAKDKAEDAKDEVDENVDDMQDDSNNN